MSIDPASFGALGLLVATNTWQSGEQILQAALDPGSDARKLVLCMCSLRQCRKSILSADSLLEDHAARQSGGRPKKPRILLNFTEALFGWYCVMRRVVHVANSLKQRQVVIWLDNFYKRRFGVNPTHTDRSLNATAMCVLHIPRLGRYRGHMSLKELVSLVKPMASLIRVADKRLSKWITDLVCSPVQYGEIRSPLDITRSGVKSLKWLPLTLEDKALGGRGDLLKLLSQLDEFRQESTGQLPVLVDENIWWRIQKGCME